MKANFVPIEVTDAGFVQHAQWRHADRMHEEVVDLDSPHAATVAAGTQMFTFVIVGDQNAGKSTFLHSFSFNQDARYLEFLSLLPVIASNFVNSRFLPPDSARPNMDELPFLDTDVGHATVVLTADDFAFFVTEHNLDHGLILDAPPDTSYFALQFIEFGGDHLDELMNPELCETQTARDIVERSRRMLSGCLKIVYFANGGTLLSTEDCFITLLRRLSFLASACPNVSFLIPLTRCPGNVTADALDLLFTRVSPVRFSSAAAMQDAAGAKILAAPAVALCLQNMFHKLAASNPAFAFLARGVDVHAAEHLHADGSLAGEGIVATLALMFAHNMTHGLGDPRFMAARHLFACFRQPMLRLSEDVVPEFSLWITVDIFHAYLEQAHDATELPSPMILQAFEPMGDMLVARGVAIRHHGHHLGALALVMMADNAAPVTFTSITDAAALSLPHFRFPYFAPLLDALEYYFGQEVPGELWLSGPFLHPCGDVVLRRKLEVASAGLHAAVAQAWCDATTDNLSECSLLRWLWLIEEATLAARLLASDALIAQQLPVLPASVALVSQLWAALTLHAGMQLQCDGGGGPASNQLTPHFLCATLTFHTSDVDN